MRVEHSVLVDRPLAEVWAFLSDYRNDPRFIDAVSRVELATDGPIEVGTTLVRTMRLPVVNVTVDASVKVIAVEPEQRTAFEAHGAGMSFIETRTVSSEGAKTRVTFRLEGDPKGAVKLGERMMTWQAKRAMEADLSSLKRVLERG